VGNLLQDHPEFAAEQAYITKAYEHLELMRSRAVQRGDKAILAEKTGHVEHLFTRDAVVESAYGRAATLTIGDLPLIFGRIDTRRGETYYIGRTAVHDDNHEPLVIDWRAAVAEPFYRATGKNPMNLVRRRHFMCRASRLVGIEDDVLSKPKDDSIVLIGEGALLASLERSRTGRMGDVVATIQSEQDRVIRAPLEKVVVVQGPPGTGKTVVALHRAAYLLYTYRRRLERRGVLLIGPNPIFLRYIEDVLPSLGEHFAVLATPATLLAGITATGSDLPEVARSKGEEKMSETIAEAVGNLGQAIDEPVSVIYENVSFSLEPDASRRIVSRVRRMKGTHNSRRRVLQSLVVRDLYECFRRAEREEVKRGWRGPDLIGLPPKPPREFASEMRRNPGVRTALARMWPVMGAERFVGEILFGKAKRRQWSEEDIPLIDAARELLGETKGPRRARRKGRGGVEDRLRAVQTEALIEDIDESQGIDTLMQQQIRDRLSAGPEMRRMDERDEDRLFGHVLVDEAHDLSPMQWMMIGRRCSKNSMTILGDLGQSSGSWNPQSWREALAALHLPIEPEVMELTINYRTPEEIMTFARRLVDVAAPRSVRRSGRPPEQVKTTPKGARADLLRAVSSGVGKTAVIVAESQLDLVRGYLSLPDSDADILEADVACLSVRQAKGLEFDSVVVFEPVQIMEEHLNGRAALYVAFTRATQSLTVVASSQWEPLRPGE
jgi:DNA helicase IV